MRKRGFLSNLVGTRERLELGLEELFTYASFIRIPNYGKTQIQHINEAHEQHENDKHTYH